MHPYSSKLSKDTKRVTWSAVVQEISAWQNKTKQNKLPCFIDRCTKVLSIKSKSVWYARHYNTKLWEKKKKHGSLLTSTHIPYLIIYLCLPHPTYNSSLFSHHHLWTWKCVQYKVREYLTLTTCTNHSGWPIKNCYFNVHWPLWRALYVGCI